MIFLRFKKFCIFGNIADFCKISVCELTRGGDSCKIRVRNASIKKGNE